MIIQQKTSFKRKFFVGAVERARTVDLLLGKETLYQLSYYRDLRSKD